LESPKYELSHNHPFRGGYITRNFGRPENNIHALQLAMAETHPDYYPAVIMNYKLGGGGFASRLTQELREGKGYTYGIGSSFNGSALPGPFVISSRVRTNITYEASDLIKQILEDYDETFTEEDLENTKSYFLKSNARAFETANAKLNMLEKLTAYGWSPEFIKEREEIVKNMTVSEIRKLASVYADPDKLIYVIVGDAETQLDKIRQLGYGEPVLIRDLDTYKIQ
ncbi:MAG: insulinase family protein, partial [Cyclobacteriaceae bacterium]